MRRWRAAAALLGAATLGLSAATAGGAGASTRNPVDLGGTPVLSVRRLPGWIETTVGQQRLADALKALAGPGVLGTANPVGCVLVTQGDTVLFSANADTPFIPASNMKVLTATAVLDRLGANDQLTTEVEADRSPEHGVVYGNVYLVGGGDPLLRTGSYAAGLHPPQPLYTSIEQLAEQVRRAGVSEITGLVVGDDHRYDSERTVATWKPVYSTEGDVGPLSALDVNDGFVPKPPPPKPAPPPPGSPATTTTTTVPESSTAAAFAYAAASDPPETAASVFAQLLRHDGVAVDGGAASGYAPVGAPLITSIASAPLAKEVDAMLNVSDDTAAELFTKELGYQASRSGTTAAGTAAIRADLAADGLPVSQLVNVDGSGLDRDDRVSCTLIAAALRRAGPDGVIGQGLPVAGKTGTLATRMLGTPAVGRLRAKTGTLDEVVSLSGFVTPVPASAPSTALKQPIVFSIILNGLSSDSAEGLADTIAVALASYPHVPAIGAVSPVP